MEVRVFMVAGFRRDLGVVGGVVGRSVGVLV